MESLTRLLSDPLTIHLISTHPNIYAVTSTSPRLPGVSDWLDLVQFYSTGELERTCNSSRIPDELIHLISSIRYLQLHRGPIPMPKILRLHSEQGMSPKKAHEVSRMATYIVDLAPRLASSSSSSLRIVDIGAGQGYLTRALKAHLPNSHILALDADVEQTKGAQKWEKRLLPKEAQRPPIDHKVVFISPDTLLATVDEWINELEEGWEKLERVPVLFVALHACGSLTPDVLRAFIHVAKNNNTDLRNWYPAGVVVVGCCYNLMNPSDYPPSTKHLPISAYHLAAQIPSQWLLPSSNSSESPKIDPAVALSIRKVTWRALLSKSLESSSSFPSNLAPPDDKPHTQAKSATVPARWSRRPSSVTEQQYDPPESGTGLTPTMNRLGRLRDSVYTSWNTFLHAAEDKLGVKFDEMEFDVEEEGDIDRHIDGPESPSRLTVKEEKDERRKMRKERGRDQKLENELAVLHVMRCLLGPAIESVILLDRIGWVRKELGLGVASDDVVGKEGEETGSTTTSQFRADLVNLFDQATGSGRNVAIVVVPQTIDLEA
ncbi:methyltransferase domain-containing protein [Gymnopilus junonius]|uniref:Methyltransferase domain-containing protein n=1 Tax=Gymnopilus junonius TaxID=109634 RepID=A0A9P5TLW6_GYMJU|nr:methyltransferase domain-containing protein [Gymnopilus junonius]